MADYPRSPVSAVPGQNTTAMTKAQQFEDEKRRIMQSCFSRQDSDGSLLESYITHCRVTEDATTNEPPGPGSVGGERKARVIMVAVRKSGRVRMHKGRENANGSFSIGKTWNLDDLQAIQSYPPPHEKGFTVTILKPYYWQANSAKEKDFFVSSLVKIYKKYTGGKAPELIGFGKSELDALLGPGGAAVMVRQKEEDARSPKTSSPVSSVPSSLSSSIPRNLSSTQSTESLSKSSRPQYLGQRALDSKAMGPPSPNTMRPMKSTDGLSGRRTPVEAQSRSTPPPPPIPQAAPMSSTSRRPSDGSTKSSQSRAQSSTRTADDDRSMRRQPSQDGNRAASINSQMSADSRREALEQYPYQASKLGSSPTPPLPEALAIPQKKSSKDTASQLRLAANTYGLGAALSRDKSRPKTPTTPIYTSALSREPSNISSSPPDTQPPAVPQLKNPLERGRSGDQPNGGYAAYNSRPSLESQRPRPSLESQRPRPSLESQRPRSPSWSKDPPLSPMPIEVAPLVVPKEPPPRSEARGRPLPSRENSQSSTPTTPISKSSPIISEPALMIRKPTLPTPAVPTVSPPPNEPSVEVQYPRGREPKNDGMTLQAPPGASRTRSKSRGLKRRSSAKTSYLDGIDKTGMSVDIEELLQEFNWDAHGKIDQLKSDVRKELSRVESSNVVAGVDGDDRVEQLAALLDEAIKECEEMDGLLTLYAVELTSLNDDIAHIENQSQGLQLQTANQKTLQKELQTLLDTISISPAQMEILRQGSLESPRGLEQIEQTLMSLYKAMKTIEPSNGSLLPSAPMGHARRGSFASEEGIGSMRALQERKEEYRNSTRAFLGRLHQFLNIKFQAELMEIKKEFTAANSAVRPRMAGHDKAYQNLWKFSGLIAFARDVDGDEYVELRRLYEKPVKTIVMEEIREHIAAWKKITKKPTQEEQDLVFTAPEKEELVDKVYAARKLTVKKSIARIRTGGGSFVGGDRPTPGIIAAYEAFSGAFAEIYNLVFKEQNFVVDFFHLSSRNSQDFVEFVSAGGPENRRSMELGGLRNVEPDKLKAKLIFEYVSDIFAPLMQDLQNMIEWATQGDATQAVGIMYAIEQKLASLQNTDQEFLQKMLRKLHDRLAGLFSRFLDDQVKAIEETKVKIKKRKGVILFMRVFPGFAARIEEQIPYDRTTGTSDELDVREIVNDGYSKINKAMFESLHAIAKESPAVTSQTVDPEDKEQLNYHIMMIENMYHYLEEVDTRGNRILEAFRKRADDEYREHMGLYIGAVIRRPLAKLLDFIENAEAIVKAGGTTMSITSEDIPSRSAHSKAAFKKVLENNDGKDIRKGIEALKKRVDKHFGDDHRGGDAPVIEKILSRLEDEYINVHKRIMLLLVGPYKECGLECSFMVNDVKMGFKNK